MAVMSTEERDTLKRIKAMIADRPDANILDAEAAGLVQFSLVPTDPSKITLETWRRLHGLQNLRIRELEARFDDFLVKYEAAYNELLSMLMQAITQPIVEDEEAEEELVLQSQQTPAPPTHLTAGSASAGLDKSDIASGAYMPGLGGQLGS